MYSQTRSLSDERDYKIRRQEAVREARETAARAVPAVHNVTNEAVESISNTIESAADTIKKFISRVEIDDILLIGLFLIILSEGIEDNLIILLIIGILIFID